MRGSWFGWPVKLPGHYPRIHGARERPPKVVEWQLIALADGPIPAVPPDSFRISNPEIVPMRNANPLSVRRYTPL